MRDWLKLHQKAVARAVVMAVVAAVGGWLLYKIGRVAPGLPDAQVASGRSDAALKGARELKDGLKLDFLFIVVYVLLGVAAFSPIRDPKRPGHLHPAAWAGIILGAGGGLADVGENVLLWRALDGNVPSRTLAAMRAAGLVKWGLVGAAALTLVTLLLRRPWRRPTTPLAPTNRPEPAPCPSWNPPKRGAEPKVGVCLSGGGIRSAAFSLGALQALRKHGKLAKAKYLAAASGGGYLAAGWAVSQAGFADCEQPAPGPPEAWKSVRWGPGSTEERWFRNHASYLIPNLAGGLAGLFRLLAGLVVNLLLVALVVSAAARPVGWAMHALHPKLRDPVVDVRDPVATMQVASVEEVERHGRVHRYVVNLDPNTEKHAAGRPFNDACFSVLANEPNHPDVCVGAKQLPGKAGVVEVRAGRATVVAQPRVRVDFPADEPGCDDECPAVRKAARVKEQPKIALKDDRVADRLTADAVVIERQPSISVSRGLDVMAYPNYTSWMWQLVGGLVGMALLIALCVMVLRLRARPAAVGKALANAVAAAGVVAFLVIVGLPWLVVWLPRTLSSVFAGGTTAGGSSGVQDYAVPSTSVVALFVTAGWKYLRPAKVATGANAAPGVKPWYRKLWDGLSSRSGQLKWYSLSPLKIVLAVASALGLLVVFVNALQFATANGVRGERMGLAFVRDHLPDWLFVADALEFVVIAGLLLLFALAADAQSWSLYPFYKTRLSSAFLLRRNEEGEAESIPYTQFLPFTEFDGAPASGPQLVACCAVNLSEYGVVPPGRRAASFTFSSTEIGGPVVGYATPAEYEGLPLSRKRDVTIASAMAISGAAFSPAMGKFNLGPVGGLLALANLRLGVWIPHPQRMKARPSKWWWRFRRPNWVWFFRELTNKYGFDRRYLYVSDGGHWDNLGLVELLRRGCTEIYCISGAGDGALSFGTIGEAIALAREELGVEIHLDPSPLRSALGDPPKPPAPPLPPIWTRVWRWVALSAPPAPAPAPAKRELRRDGAKDKSARFAAASVVRGTFRFTRAEGDVAEGVIYYVEADLTADMPFDVHTFAESEPVFPDDSTGDQVFDHRQFESYRALGYHQAVAACELP